MGGGESAAHAPRIGQRPILPPPIEREKLDMPPPLLMLLPAENPPPRLMAPLEIPPPPPREKLLLPRAMPPDVIGPALRLKLRALLDGTPDGAAAP